MAGEIPFIQTLFKMAILAIHDFESSIQVSNNSNIVLGNNGFAWKQVGGIGGTAQERQANIQPQDLERSTDYSRMGTYSLRTILRRPVWQWDPPLSRSEFISQDFRGSPNVESGYVAFSFLLATDSASIPNQTFENVIVFQLWEGGTPGISVNVRLLTNAIRLLINDGSSTTPHNIVSNPVLGQWYDIIVRYHSRTDETGFVKVWLNEQLVINTTGKNAHNPIQDQTTPYVKIGGYSSAFGDTPSDEFICYHDMVIYADDNDSEEWTLQQIHNILNPQPGPAYYRGKRWVESSI